MDVDVKSVHEEPMSSSYAEGLSPYDNKGKLGLKEIFDNRDEISKKVKQLATWLREAQHAVFHTGAGISTAAGIPDFRGPQGVWTLEAKGLKPNVNVSFNNAIPTKTHMALKFLVEKGLVKYVISQNIDGLHLRSGLPRHNISELHGNMFTEQCSHCDRVYVRNKATTSVGERCLGRSCSTMRPGGRPCRGKVRDTILDWEANLPERELSMAEWHSGMADLSVSLGTTLQILPSGNLPLLAKKRGGRVVICNLQPTKHDKKGDLLIHTYVDDILEELMQNLYCNIPHFISEHDPTLKAATSIVDWTISNKVMQSIRRLHSEICKSIPKKNNVPCKKHKLSKEESVVIEPKEELSLAIEDPSIDFKVQRIKIENNFQLKNNTDRVNKMDKLHPDVKYTEIVNGMVQQNVNIVNGVVQQNMDIVNGVVQQNMYIVNGPVQQNMNTELQSDVLAVLETNSLRQ